MFCVTVAHWQMSDRLCITQWQDWKNSSSLCYSSFRCTFCIYLLVFKSALLPCLQPVRRNACVINWRAPWKNRISSTTMKLRKSLVKPVTRQNISSCLILPPEIVMHDAFNVTLWTSADICVVHDDLVWKNRTTHCNKFWRAGCSQLEYIDIRSVY